MRQSLVFLTFSRVDEAVKRKIAQAAQQKSLDFNYLRIEYNIG